MNMISTMLQGKSMAVKTAAVLLGSWLIAAGAYIEVPLWPVPMTMQSLAVILIGGACGMRMAGATTLAYLAQGAAGLPVFAGGAGGFVHLFGPTGGYLFGFVISAMLIAYLCERGYDGTWLKLTAALFAGSVALLGCGTVWLAGFVGWENAFMTGVAPFIAGMVVKLFLAAAIICRLNRISR